MNSNIEMFFDADLKIKEILYNTLFREEDCYDESTLASYSDKLYSAINEIEFYINKIVSIYFSYEIDYCHDYFSELRSKLADAGYDRDRLKKFYEVYFSNMREELVNQVGTSCIGYYLFSGVPFSNATSINELLHIIHQSIVNNRDNFKELPVTFSKKNLEGYDIILYGDNNYLARDIYESFDEALDCGTTDIVSFKDRILMMVRDRGHALSIEIEEKSDKCFVKYFIPKICNVEMVNALKGVKRVDSSSRYTIGMFYVSNEELASQLMDFISKVPTDSDMDYFIEDGKSFK